MLPPRIVLLIGKEGDAIHEIRRSLSPAYQVVIFEKLEKEIAWFKPMAVILHQNGSPLEEEAGRVARLRQFQPKAPVLLCASSAEAIHQSALPKGVKACFAWPEGLGQLQAHLQQCATPGPGLWKRLQQAFAKLNVRQKVHVRKAASRPAETAAAQPSFYLEARFLGSWKLSAEGKALPWISSEINRAMLAYLFYYQKDRMLRRKAIDGFWPDSSEDSARNCLNVAISSVRRYLKENIPETPAAIHFRENAYSLEFDKPINTDVHEFLRLWEYAQAMERAQRPDEALDAYRRAGQLYRGEFLECISREIIWVESVRSKLKEIHLAMLDRLSELLMERQLFPEAISTCHRILEIDDCIESAHRRLMACFTATQRRGMALRQYHQCRKALEEKLEARPSRETEALLTEIQG